MMAFLDEAKKIFAEAQRRQVAEQAKQYARVGELISNAWEKAMTELIEDEGLRRDIAVRAAEYMLNAAEEKAARANQVKQALTNVFQGRIDLNEIGDAFKALADLNK